MLVQYPDTLFVPGVTAEAVFADGIYTPGTASEPITQIGRYEPSTLNAEQQLADGSKAKLKGIFYMPVTGPDIDPGIEVTITNRLGDSVLKTKVLFSTRGQLSSRVFL